MFDCVERGGGIGGTLLERSLFKPWFQRVFGEIWIL